MRNRFALLVSAAMLGIVFPAALAQPSDAGLLGREYCVIADVLLESDAPEVTIDLPGDFPEFMILRGITSATVGIADDLLVNFNSDLGPNYSWHYHGSQGFTNVCELGCNTSKAVGDELNRGFVSLDVGNSPDDYSFFVAEIVNSPGTFKKIMARDTARGSLGNAIHVTNSTWRSVAPIDSMTLAFYNGDIRAGSRFVLLALDEHCDGAPVPLCHCPNGRPDKCKTKHVGAAAAISHLANHPDDALGECP